MYYRIDKLTEEERKRYWEAYLYTTLESVAYSMHSLYTATGWTTRVMVVEGELSQFVPHKEPYTEEE